jgi:VCPO second helical-bundle domain
VLDFRHHDGSNQLNGYADYTGYEPANAPMDVRPLGTFQASTVRDPSRWQPLRYVDGDGNDVTPRFIAPHWQHVVPFALSSTDALRSPTGPARFGTPEYIAQAQALVDISAALTDEQKTIAEYWADGPRTELPPGHWNLFAQFVARRERHGGEEHGVDLDVKLFFALTNAIFDAGICAWDNKRFFDSVRPITAIRYAFQGQTIRAWGGPYRGTRDIDGAEWFPYQPSTFPTPPFAEYSSGHSNFSAAGAEILRLFTGSERFGASVTIGKGAGKVEPGAVPAREVTLSWATFKDAADQAGISRRYGGIHFEQGDLDARATGRMAAKVAWAKAQDYWNGTA